LSWEEKKGERKEKKKKKNKGELSGIQALARAGSLHRCAAAAAAAAKIISRASSFYIHKYIDCHVYFSYVVLAFSVVKIEEKSRAEMRGVPAFFSRPFFLL
jgi:hypothetical protein